MSLPPIVVEARRRAEATGFVLSSEPDVGTLLACLAASVGAGGRILEIGTGVGCGLAWLVHGLGARTDVEVVTVDIDDRLQARPGAEAWPAYVRFELGDGAVLVARLGTFDLIFADAPSGKTTGLSGTINALRSGGTLVVDDMDVTTHNEAGLRNDLTRVRERLLGDRRLVCAELAFSSGVVVAVRRWDDAEG